MVTQQLGLFQALGAKMNYLDQRQKVISQNIANANTPDYKPKDLEKVDFESALQGITGDTASSISPSMTSPLHMSANALPIADSKSRQLKNTYDVMPTGNAVVMEEQMVRSTETQTDYQLMTAIYQKNISMMKAALGTGR